MAGTATTTYGATVAFGTTSYSAKITDIDGAEPTRSAIDTSHLGLTAYDTGVSAFRTFIPGGFIDGGELSLDLVWDMGDEPPISQAAETITITFVGTSGGVADGSLAFSGFVTSYKYNGPMDDRWGGTVTVKVAGEPTWTDAS